MPSLHPQQNNLTSNHKARTQVRAFLRPKVALTLPIQIWIQLFPHPKSPEAVLDGHFPVATLSSPLNRGNPLTAFQFPTVATLPL
jgi:hypothetical protein